MEPLTKQLMECREREIESLQRERVKAGFLEKMDIKEATKKLEFDVLVPAGTTRHEAGCQEGVVS